MNPKYYSTAFVLRRLRALVRQYETQTDCAKALSISSSYLCDVLQGKRGPGASVLKHLGLKAITVYVQGSNRKAPD